VSGSDKPFDAGRPRPIPTVLDTLRARLDLDAVDAVAFSLESVVADLGYGDLRPLPGSVAWIDRLRADGKRTALMFSGESAAAALRLAGIDDRFDAVLSGPRTPETVREALAAVGAAPERAIVVDVLPDGLVAAREAGCRLSVAVARGPATPEALRRSGAAAIVADLQELLGPA
jgi:HAD superfamily hydrolase (TIGR01509 family)